MKVTARWEYPQIANIPGQVNNLLLQISTPDISGQTKRNPLAIILVIDKSWSMKGQKIDETLEAAKTIISWLTRMDYIGIVAYSSDIQIVQPLTQLSEKKSILRKIETIQVGTATNLSGGWLQGLKMAQEAIKIPGSVKRVLLLTDGRATMGLMEDTQFTDIARKHAALGITTTAIGFGTDFREETLGEIARAGQGNFHFVDSPEKISDIFYKEFGDIGALYAQAAELKVTCGKGVKFHELLDDLDHEVTETGLNIHLGDLRSDDMRNLVLSMEADGSANLSEAVNIELSCYRLGDELKEEKLKTAIPLSTGKNPSAPDKTVEVEILIAQAGKTLLQASQMAETDVDGACEVLENMVQRLTDRRDDSSESFDRLIQSLDDLKRRLREDRNTGRKHLLAAGSSLYNDRSDLGFVRSEDMHDNIMEYRHKGDMDLYNVPEFKQQIRSKIAEGYRNIIVDMSETTFIDSSAVGALIQVAGWVLRRGGMLVVCNLNSSLEKLFQTTRLDTYIPIAESTTDGKMLIESGQSRA